MEAVQDASFSIWGALPGLWMWVESPSISGRGLPANKRGRAVSKYPLRRCRFCGCTDATACLAEDGLACYWLADDLCSACGPAEIPPPGVERMRGGRPVRPDWMAPGCAGWDDEDGVVACLRDDCMRMDDCQAAVAFADSLAASLAPEDL